MNLVIAALFLALIGTSSNLVDGTVDGGITTRSVEAVGVFYCGKIPAQGVRVALKRELTDDVDDIIGKTVTDENGRFKVSGNTERYGGAKTTLDPVLNIYHKCDRDEGKAYQTFTLRFPRTYVTQRITRRQYDLGKLNLQIGYPGQKDEKTPPV